ncbi:MAG: hypothetical protein HC925_05555 [Coleofasciculaceae cyanobacterium SM2_3_26]|nr:hypothetical protein [Coleofasciculaceae cyanobacterium SM2_3_26]
MEIVYAIGGSPASGMHGEVRSTRDVNLMALLTPEDVIDLASFNKADIFGLPGNCVCFLQLVPPPSH